MHRTRNMIKRAISLCLLLPLAAGVLRAHFPFLIPAADGATAVLVMSETLDPDEDVPVSLLSEAKLSMLDSRGVEHPIAAPPKDSNRGSFVVALPGSGTRVLHGVADLGVQQRKGSVAHCLVYYVRSVVGNPLDQVAQSVGDSPIAFVAVVGNHCYHLRLLVDGRPAAGRPVQLLLADGSETEVQTDAEGRTPPLMPGRVGAWARDWKHERGERNGKAFEQVRRYATFVADLPDPHAPQAKAANSAGQTMFATRRVGGLARPVASFGATIADGWLYVFGGHTGERHDYSTETVSGQLDRIRVDDLLAGTSSWERLPDGPPAQGLELVGHGQSVIRAGGMQPRNADGEPSDNHSLDLVMRMTADCREWSPMTSLPVARSSHGAVQMGSMLALVGGWRMTGGNRGEFVTETAMLDLQYRQPKWKSIPQPFRRRALVAAAMDHRLFAIGGFDEADRPVLAVDVLDTRTGEWTQVPPLPGDVRNGFGPAAAVLGGRLYVSVASGDLFRLAENEQGWDLVARTTPRIVHRMVAYGDKLLVLGGASGSEMSDLIEAVDTSSAKEGGGACPHAKDSPEKGRQSTEAR